MESVLQIQLSMREYVKVISHRVVQGTHCGLCRRTHGKLKRNSNAILK